MGSYSHIAIIILAAGGSSRMKQPKQLLSWGENTLLGHTMNVALESEAGQVYVVLGAHMEQIKPKIDNPKTIFISHNGWKQGIGSSISCAAHYILNAQKGYKALLFMLCDQPLIDAEYLNDMLCAFDTGNKKIIATAYKQGNGVPVLFHKKYIPELAALGGDSGAKEVIVNNIEEVLSLKPNGKQIDLDTFEEYQHLKNQTNL
ncbi:nucleotidyltransferase family protein [Maribacter polysaccharolyticus]|uniref:nucleotidyltransferase family protein n=1 Tax=Maribacter polysaccharolyticus TaxID=3020831 RepID=UPI00237F6CF4|nr:nucleotidyltransferase family protein [Maribacter polysaccharolyticus]MDE3740444.1 nucleotidyltransferase family protein [Maribacter polysaccharolyticus]